jgi:ATP-dependent Zn protease
MFYQEPQNEFEQKLNEEKLSALQDEQLLLLNRLFDKNIEVFKALAEVLLEKRTLKREELVSFLAQVELPDGFPDLNR